MAGAKPDTAETWRGTYKSAAGGLYLPPEIKASWKPTETPAGIGEGSLSFTVSPGEGRVRGELEGPLGPATITGLVADGGLTATVARKEPRDHGFAGTMIGNLGHDKGEGALKLSLAEGGAIRTGTFVVSPAAASPHAPTLAAPSQAAADGGAP
jgi:hypothetical protein